MEIVVAKKDLKVRCLKGKLEVVTFVWEMTFSSAQNSLAMTTGTMQTWKEEFNEDKSQNFKVQRTKVEVCDKNTKSRSNCKLLI